MDIGRRRHHRGSFLGSLWRLVSRLISAASQAHAWPTFRCKPLEDSETEDQSEVPSSTNAIAAFALTVIWTGISDLRMPMPDVHPTSALTPIRVEPAAAIFERI